MELAAGQNTALAGRSITITTSGAVDLTALVLSADGRVSGDSDMVFFNQPAAPGATLSGRTLALELDRLRPGAERIALVASPEVEDLTFGAVPGLRMEIRHGGGALTFTPTPQGSETALVLCDVYLRQGPWKVRALGQRYDPGLAGVATEYGIDGAAPPAPPAATPSAAAAPPTATPAAAPAPPAPAPPPRPRLDLAKVPVGQISLAKSGEAKIPLVKEDRGKLRLKCSLRWQGRTGSGTSDLDLYALFIDDDGVEKTVYYKDRGSLTKAPFIKLDKDSRGAGEENITVVAGHHRYVLFCAYSALGNGAGSFHSYRAHVVVDDGQGSTITVPLYSKKAFSYWVAIALLDFNDPSGVSVRQVEQYGRNFSEKRPLLAADGTFRMSAGKVEFKRT